ncbi:MAG: hypothetical protein SVY15_09835, partial [Halobacteriota archaeon]|nr:hypothetical protein [Halobacteriota archaeon]
TELKEFESRLNIKKPSYDYEKRCEMLLNWACEFNCIWLEKEGLKELVLSAMKDGKILPTPLSIKDFALATFDKENIDEIEKEIKNKSKATAVAFAKEIKNMTDDKILLLSFPFISSDFGVSFVKDVYQELTEELELKDAWGFDRVLNWFKDDKINIKYWLRGEVIEFSHPSYSEALGYILIEDGELTKINRDLFSRVLFKLSEKDGAAGYVAWAVARNFNELPEDVRNQLLIKLSEKDDAAGGVARAVADNFNELPQDVRNLLFKLSEKDRAAGGVARAVARNFNELPQDVRDILDIDRIQESLQNYILENIDDEDYVLGIFSKAGTKIERDFLYEILGKLKESEDEKVRLKALDRIRQISESSIER